MTPVVRIEVERSPVHFSDPSLPVINDHWDVWLIHEDGRRLHLGDSRFYDQIVKFATTISMWTSVPFSYV
jgi:hypothetical protein